MVLAFGDSFGLLVVYLLIVLVALAVFCWMILVRCLLVELVVYL